MRGTDYKLAYAKNKNVGVARVTVKGLGAFAGSATDATFTIVPKAAKLKKLVQAKKALKVTWAKQAKQVGGYQILLATDKKFKKGKKTVVVAGAKKTSKQVKGLKSKKRYFVKIRTYKKAAGTTYYSAWSKVKKKATK